MNTLALNFLDGAYYTSGALCLGALASSWLLRRAGRAAPRRTFSRREHEARGLLASRRLNVRRFSQEMREVQGARPVRNAKRL